MVVSCCAYGCTERFTKDGPFTFHCFPKDEIRRELWEKQLRRENFKSNNSTRICSKHFEAECFEKDQFGKRRLRADAVPTIFDFLWIYRNVKSRKRTTGEGECSTTIVATPSVKEFRCVGDFEEKDMESPAKARKLLLLAKSDNDIMRKKQSFFRKKNRSLAKKISALEEIISKAKKGALISDSDASVSSVSDENATASKGEPIPLEPTVVIKEEPIEFEPTPSTSSDPDCLIKEKFILPYEENAWTSADSRSSSGVEPSIQATFSLGCLGTEQDKTSSTTPALGNPLKRKRKDNPSKLSVSGSAQKVAKTSLDSGIAPAECPQAALVNADDSSNLSSLFESKASDRPHDQFEAFAEYVAAKLRILDRRSCACAQKAIGDIIFDSEMGKFIEGAK